MELQLVDASWYGTAEGIQAQTALHKPVGLLEDAIASPTYHGAMVDRKEPKVLVRGPPGCGKTHVISQLAGAAASEAYSRTLGLQCQSCLWPAKTISERRYALAFTFWDTSSVTTKTLTYLESASIADADIVLHVVSMTEPFRSDSLDSRIAALNAASKAAHSAMPPAHVVVITREEQLDARRAAVHAIEEWAQDKELRCIRLQPGVASVRSALTVLADIYLARLTMQAVVASLSANKRSMSFRGKGRLASAARRVLAKASSRNLTASGVATPVKAKPGSRIGGAAAAAAAAAAPTAGAGAGAGVTQP